MNSEQLSTSATSDTVTRILVRAGVAGERPAGYTRMIATDPEGPNLGNLFLTWDAGAPEGYPIYRSSGVGDAAGMHWEQAGSATGGVGAGGFRMQPSLYELPTAFMNMPKGTLLLAGKATSPDQQSSNIVIFASNDRGSNWRPISHIDSGGPIVYDPSPESVTSTIWEPELELIDGTMFCFYSDERYKGDGMLQVIVHRSSQDLLTWSDRVVDFGIPDRNTRPGMFVAAKNISTDYALGVVELVGRPLVPINLIHTNEPTCWGAPDDVGTLLTAEDGTWLSGTPNLTWSSPPDYAEPVVLVTGRFAYDAAGKLVDRALINVNGGKGPWQSIELPLSPGALIDSDVLAGYSQTLLLTHDGRHLVQATTTMNSIGTTDVIVAVQAFEGVSA